VALFMGWERDKIEVLLKDLNQNQGFNRE